MSVEEFSINAILTDQVEDNFLTYNFVGIKIPFLDFFLKKQWFNLANVSLTVLQLFSSFTVDVLA